ncbi:hypothetical protein QNH23_13015 [Siminovitchia fortis]|uniref:Uncharacterized protein n=1 Tax=Siminovitchia fortis TaxID=254758 RepID=A0A443IM15_9BACI|nr:hypothetical protein [Siminovitchia fortis]RWR06539.1 hypothetical protein D4N35_014165 [Siminovitchia fortis]WHY80833.1 hypothetical protein QNH23_13015 [Siminovitchia fortis]
MNKKLKNIGGWGLFLISTGLFLLQMAFLFLYARFQVEYTDNRLFYLINILSSIFLWLALLLLLQMGKKQRLLGGVFIALFIFANGIFLTIDLTKTHNIVSLSPDLKHVLSIKENKEKGQATYYRTFYHILARPKESLPYKTAGDFKVKWLANDVAAVTYQSTDKSIHQYIGTYGDRGGGGYYYVGPSIYGRWSGGNIEVISGQEGIKVIHSGGIDTFNWEQAVQFGTLAIVLTNDDEAMWTIALNENFRIQSESLVPPIGNISIYKATMENSRPVTLKYAGS